jgi:hypothetical protein
MVQQILQILGFIFEGIGLVAGITIAALVMKKDARYIGNRLMATTMILLGIYMGAILVYDIFYPIFKQDWIIQVFYRICLIALFLGTMFLFFTIRVMCHSSAWLTVLHTVPYAIIITGYSIWIWWIDFLEIISGDQVNTQTADLTPLLILIIGVTYFIVYSIYGIFTYGMKRAEGARKKKMTTFFIGLVISLLAVVINVLSNVLDDSLGIFDVIFFGTLAIAMIVMMIGFVGRQPEKKEEEMTINV